MHMSFKSKLLKSILKRSSSQKSEARMKNDTVMRFRTQANFELMTHPTGHSSVQRQGFWSHQIWAGKSECHLHNNVRFSSFGQRFRLFLYHQGESLCRMVRINTVCWHKQQLYVFACGNIFHDFRPQWHMFIFTGSTRTENISKMSHQIRRLLLRKHNSASGSWQLLII